ncbi:uncharacterized protein LOC135849527 [Planococcus citri]|uniref:uncharacterized protein LOC135849527 n=1 Tax=Planococcus citri TaxID=170843 RepID=UPI0031F865E7
MMENIWIKFVLVVQVLVGRSACNSVNPNLGLPPVYVGPNSNGEPSNESLSEETKSSNTDYDIARVLHPRHWTSIHTQTSNLLIKRNAEYFEELITNNVIVDKSLLIKHIFEDSESDHLLITGPRKWGKSTNLKMIHTFAEKLDKNGEVMVPENTLAYNYFKKGKCLERHYYYGQDVNMMIDMTEPPLISEYQTVLKYHLLKYSVIHLDFTMDIPFTFQEFLKLFRGNIITTFKEKQYLREKLRDINTEETAEMLTKFNRIVDTFQHAPDNQLLIESVELLCTCIRTCYPELPILILVDEYDIIFNEIFFSGDVDHNDPEVKLMIKFFKDFTSNSFRSYENSAYQYSKVILTGICKLINADLFASLSNFEEWSMFEEPNIYPFYGFTANEVDILLDKRGRLADKERVHALYAGYRPITHPDRPSFNPISMICYLNAKELGTYWIKTGAKLSAELPKLFKSFQIRLAFQPFLTDVKILRVSKKAISPSLDELKEISDLRRADKIIKPLSDSTIEWAIGVLLSIGYLSLSERQPTYQKSFQNDGEGAHYREYIYVTIPDREIGEDFVDELHKYCYHLQNRYSSPFDNATVAFRDYFYSDNDYYQFLQLKTSLKQLFSTEGLYENVVNDFKQLFDQKNGIPEEQVDLGFSSNNEAATHYIIFETLLNWRRENPAISLGTECSFDYTSPVIRTNKYRIDTIIWHRDTVLIIETKEDKTETLDDILSRARNYLLLFAERKFEVYKLIGMDVLDNGDGGVPIIKLKQEILGQKNVQAFYNEFKEMEEAAIKLNAQDNNITDEKEIKTAWRQLEARKAKQLIEKVRNKMPKSDLLVPPNFENELLPNLRCDPMTWSIENVDSFFAFCKQQFKLTSVKKFPCSGEMLVAQDQKLFETMCQEGGGLHVFNALQYILKKYSTD